MVEVSAAALDAPAHDERYQRLERALLADLVHDGSAVSADDVRRELATAFDRFRDVRVHTFVPILAERNARAALRAVDHR
jgi:hypothetical protein